MKTDKNVNAGNAGNGVEGGAAGWIFYDARCPWCRMGQRFTGGLFAARGFCWVPLQSPGAAARLGVDPSEFDLKLHLLDDAGQVYDNADALALLCRSVPALRPIGIFLAVPGPREAARWIYDFIARHRYWGLGGRGWRTPEGRLS